MFLIVVKLIETFSRAAFTVVATYSLSLESAGRFGLLTTFVGLFAFAMNFERHFDIQRNVVGRTEGEVDRAILAAQQFFLFNYALVIPIFVLFLVGWTHSRWTTVACGVVILVCEHIANQAYQFSMIDGRYRPLVAIAAVKNGATLLGVACLVVFRRDLLAFETIVDIWAFSSVVFSVAIAVMWMRVQRAFPHERPFSFRERIFCQHARSATHFFIGAVAILILQFDRLVVGSLLNLSETGVYFRHVLVVSVVYQVFNIASFNRIVPKIFVFMKTESLSVVRRYMRREMIAIGAVAATGFMIALAADRLTDHVYTQYYHIDLRLIGLMIVGALVRVAGDFNGLVFHASHRERVVLRAQLTAFAIGASLLVAATWRFQILGTVAASIAASLTFFWLTEYEVRRSLRASG